MSREHHREPDAAAPHPWPHPLRVARLGRAQPVPFDLSADEAERTAIADFLGLLGVATLRFKGELRAEAEDAWRMTGRLTSEITQECVSTLAPVPARIDLRVSRLFVPYPFEGAIDLDPEDEDDPDEFEDTIDPGAVALEELALSLDPYPHAQGVEPVDARAAPPGTAPLDDAELKPFAGLAALRDKMQGGR